MSDEAGIANVLSDASSSHPTTDYDKESLQYAGLMDQMKEEEE